DYTYDLQGNRLSMTITDGSGSRTTLYQYNADDLLTSETDDAGNVTTYTYDGNGALIRAEGGGSTRTYTYNLDDELTSDTVTTTDAEGHVHAVTGSYTYNALGLRATETLTTSVDGQPGTVVTHSFLYDPFNPTGYSEILEEHDGAGQLVRTLVSGDTVL